MGRYFCRMLPVVSVHTSGDLTGSTKDPSLVVRVSETTLRVRLSLVPTHFLYHSVTGFSSLL